MKILCLLAIISAFILPSFSYGNDEPLRVGYFDLPPHGTEGNVGAAIDYFKLIANEMHVRPEFSMFPLARLIKSDKVDVILYLAANPEREKRFIFSNTPLMYISGAIAIKSTSALKKVNVPSDLIGLHIGAWKDGYRSPIMQSPGVTLSDEPGEAISRRLLKMMVNNRIDGFYSPEGTSLEFAVNSLGLSDKLRVVYLPEPSTKFSVAFTKNASEKYMQNFEQAFKKVEKKIAYKKFLKNYLRKYSQSDLQQLK